MKEYGFIEALEILNEGRCEKIQPAHWNKTTLAYKIECGKLSCDPGTGIQLNASTFLGKWRCIGMKPRTEMRKYKHWLLIYNSGATILSRYRPSSILRDEVQQVIPLEGEYEYTFPEEKK